jgi:hypothetical protein
MIIKLYEKYTDLKDIKEIIFLKAVETGEEDIVNFLMKERYSGESVFIVRDKKIVPAIIKDIFLKQTGTEVSEKSQKIAKKIICDDCGDIFNSRTTLWRHKQKCKDYCSDNNELGLTDKEIISALLHQNEKLFLFWETNIL